MRSDGNTLKPRTDFVNTLLLVLVSLLTLAPGATSADIVQGVVQPTNARVLIKDASGNVISELAAGAFQIRLPAGQFSAECVLPTKKAFPIFSLSVPSTINIDCS